MRQIHRPRFVPALGWLLVSACATSNRPSTDFPNENSVDGSAGAAQSAMDAAGSEPEAEGGSESSDSSALVSVPIADAAPDDTTNVPGPAEASSTAQPDASADGAPSQPASHSSVGCGRPRGQVTVGGVDGFDAFTDPTATTQLRACGASLYIHQVGWGSLTMQQQQQVANNFAGTGGVTLEMAEATDLQTDYFSFGLTITEININAPNCSVPSCDDSLPTWMGWVSTWKSQGVVRAQYQDTPDCPPTGTGWDTNGYTDWSSPTWDSSRALASAGGGLAVDTPPSFYYQVGPQEYRDYIKAKIAWANAAGLHSTWIISPLSGNYDFVADTQQLIAEINALPPEQQPQEWAVENYGAGTTVGTETEAGSIANVALWVVMNASTYAP
jgi:hypothetical protein